MSSEYQAPLSPPPLQPKNSRALPWILGGCAVLLLVLIVLGVGGYALYRWRATTKVNASRESPASGNENKLQPDASASPTAAGSNSNSSTQPTPTGQPTSWETKASSLNGPSGTTFTLACTPGGTMHAVWGSDIYTDDSSICTAAVNAGLITYERGGTVTIELRPGRPIYGNSERNGVTTSTYGAYGRSFVFKSGTSDSQAKEAEEGTPIIWNVSTSMLAYEDGKTWKFKCPAPGKESNIWGTDVYTGDSSICTAAAHAGVITLARGGTVTVELRPGQSAYKGTTRNGVTSSDYGAYAHSFVVR